MRYVFACVEDAAGLPEGVVHKRRHLHLSRMTERVWSKYPGPVPFDEPDVQDKQIGSLTVLEAWCRAILDRSDKQFLDEFGLPD